MAAAFFNLKEKLKQQVQQQPKNNKKILLERNVPL